MSDEQKKTIVLHVEIPDIWADDLDESAATWGSFMTDEEDYVPTAQDRVEVVLAEWMREDVGITIVTLPGEKCMNDDFMVMGYTGRIVGAEARDRR